MDQESIDLIRTWIIELGELLVEYDTEMGIPEEFILLQNYPNPFNPKTTIVFSLPRSSFVTITIFNMLGNEITTLVDESVASGNYQVEWDAGGQASGVYFYRIEAGLFVQTKKLLLLK